MTNFEPDLEHGVYRVTHVLRLGGAWMTVVNDLIFVDGQPLVVLEWTPPENNHPPTVTVPLELARLTELPGPPGHYLYDGEVVDPRTQH